MRPEVPQGGSRGGEQRDGRGERGEKESQGGRGGGRGVGCRVQIGKVKECSAGLRGGWGSAAVQGLAGFNKSFSAARKAAKGRNWGGRMNRGRRRGVKGERGASRGKGSRQGPSQIGLREKRYSRALVSHSMSINTDRVCGERQQWCDIPGEKGGKWGRGGQYGGAEGAGEGEGLREWVKME